MATHTPHVQRNHHVGRPGKSTYRAHCSCGWRGHGGLTERQAEREAAAHSTPDPSTVAGARYFMGEL